MPVVQILEQSDTYVIYGYTLRDRLNSAMMHIMLVDDLSNHGVILSFVANGIVIGVMVVLRVNDISPVPLMLAVGFFILLAVVFIGLPILQARHQDRVILNYKDGTFAIDEKGKLNVYTPDQITKIRFGGASAIVHVEDGNLYNLSCYDDTLREAIREDLLTLLPDVLIETDKPKKKEG